MKYSLKATSIVESLVVLLIVVTGITGVFSLMNSSQRLAHSTERRIEAIQIARDGLEAMINVRDTNWLLYGADYENCWNVWHYNNNCIGNTGTSTDTTLTNSQGLIIDRNSDNQFYPRRRDNGITDDFSNGNYRNRFSVRRDSRGFYIQGTSDPHVEPRFTREIQIDYLSTANVSQGAAASNNPKMRVTAIVQWSDPAKSTPQRLEMSTIISNWKDRN